MNIIREIISFEEAAQIANASTQSVLLLRHSYRESLANGNHDPSLTQAGWDYAVECGKFLKEMKNVCFASSPRKRTTETVQAIIRGGQLSESEIVPHMEIHDTAMFTKPKNLADAIENNLIPTLLKEYFATGSAPGMRHIGEFAPNLLEFLTAPRPCPNVIMSTHDIVVVALLSFYKVYNFTQNDWCGYIQGVFLYKQEEQWHIAYTVPDKNDRKLNQLFV